MDLNYGPQYEDFKKEVQSFCKEYKDLRFVDSSQSPLASDGKGKHGPELTRACLLYTSPSPRDRTRSRMPSSA